MVGRPPPYTPTRLKPNCGEFNFRHFLPFPRHPFRPLHHHSPLTRAHEAHSDTEHPRKAAKRATMASNVFQNVHPHFNPEEAAYAAAEFVGSEYT